MTGLTPQSYLFDSFNLDKKRARATRAKKLGEILPCGVFNFLNDYLVKPTGMRVRQFSPERFRKHHYIHDSQQLLFEEVFGDLEELEDDDTETCGRFFFPPEAFC